MPSVLRLIDGVKSSKVFVFKVQDGGTEGVRKLIKRNVTRTRTHTPKHMHTHKHTHKYTHTHVHIRTHAHKNDVRIHTHARTGIALHW